MKNQSLNNLADVLRHRNISLGTSGCVIAAYLDTGGASTAPAVLTDLSKKVFSELESILKTNNIENLSEAEAGECLRVLALDKLLEFCQLDGESALALSENEILDFLDACRTNMSNVDLLKATLSSSYTESFPERLQ